MKRRRITFAVLVVALLVAAVLVIRDIGKDRQLTLTTLRDTPVYAERPTSLVAASHASPIATLRAGAHVHVARVRYGKDVMSVRIDSTPTPGWIVFSSDRIAITSAAAPN